MHQNRRKEDSMNLKKDKPINQNKVADPLREKNRILMLDFKLRPSHICESQPHVDFPGTRATANGLYFN